MSRSMIVLRPLTILPLATVTFAPFTPGSAAVRFRFMVTAPDISVALTDQSLLFDVPSIHSLLAGWAWYTTCCAFAPITTKSKATSSPETRVVIGIIISCLGLVWRNGSSWRRLVQKRCRLPWKRRADPAGPMPGMPTIHSSNEAGENIPLFTARCVGNVEEERRAVHHYGHFRDRLSFSGNASVTPMCPSLRRPAENPLEVEEGRRRRGLSFSGSGFILSNRPSGQICNIGPVFAPTLPAGTPAPIFRTHITRQEEPWKTRKKHRTPERRRAVTF